MKNIAHLYQAALGSNMKLVINLSFCVMKRKIYYTLWDPLLIKHSYYVLILLSNDKIETYSLLCTIWLAKSMITALTLFWLHICYSKKSKSKQAID